MTIENSNYRNQYQGNGSATSFAFTFPIAASDELLVTFTDTDGNETPLVENTHYTVTGVGDENGGSISYPISGDPLTSNEYLTLTPNVELTQKTDLSNQGGFYPSTIEQMADKLTKIAKYLQEQIDRCPKLSISTTSDPDVLSGTIASQLLACQEAQSLAEAAAVSATKTWGYSVFNIKTDNYTLTSDDTVKINIMNNSSAKAFTMPVIVDGSIYIILNIGSGILTITPAGVQTSEISSLASGEIAILAGDYDNSVWRSVLYQPASQTEVNTGTNKLKFVTPYTLANYNLFTPVGSIISFPVDSSPTGFLECDGSAISRTTYANLFSIIGTTYGVGDGSTTFNVPDFRGYSLRGYDGGTLTTAIGTAQSDNNKSHYHGTGIAQTNITDAGYVGIYGTQTAASTLATKRMDIIASTPSDKGETITETVGATEVTVKNYPVVFYIKY